MLASKGDLVIVSVELGLDWNGNVEMAFRDWQWSPLIRAFEVAE